MSRLLPIGMAAAFAVVLATPVGALGQDADHSRPAAKAQDTADKSGNKVEDAWILTKVKSKFVGEDALKDSNINVDVLNGGRRPPGDRALRGGPRARRRHRKGH